jgi:hypothetical protein
MEDAMNTFSNTTRAALVGVVVVVVVRAIAP